MFILCYVQKVATVCSTYRVYTCERPPWYTASVGWAGARRSAHPCGALSSNMNFREVDLLTSVEKAAWSPLKLPVSSSSVVNMEKEGKLSLQEVRYYAEAQRSL